MNGANALLATLGANDVTVCFANPGTSEMHFVAALDDAPSMRAVLCLFEGVATGAADGYARVSGRAGATLLHLGPGLANGWANLHNARRAHSPVVNLVGDHATYHAPLDAPLQSNLEGLAGGLEGWFRRASAEHLTSDVAAAVTAAFGPPGRVATLALPADVSWGDYDGPTVWPTAAGPTAVPYDETVLVAAKHALRTRRCALLLGGDALDTERLDLARRVTDATSTKLLMETFPSILDRGEGVADAERLIYLSEFAIEQLREVECLILVGAKEPVGFFAYPDVPSRLVGERTEVLSLAAAGADTRGALEALAEGTPATTRHDVISEVGPLGGPLSTRSFAAAVAHTLPEGVVVADESNTSGVHLFEATRHSPAHRWMTLTGGAIGYGLPVALGAAVGSGRRVLALEADGSMLYTPQALWSMAREGLDVTVVGLSNRSYAILTMELARVGASANGKASQRLLELDDPTLELAGLARAQGVPATTVTSTEGLVSALERSYATPGPSFVEVVLPKGLH